MLATPPENEQKDTNQKIFESYPYRPRSVADLKILSGKTLLEYAYIEDVNRM